MRVSNFSKIDRSKLKPDFAIVVISSILLVAGLLMIFSSSAVLANRDFGDTFYFVKRQILWIVAGSFLGFLLYRSSIQGLKRWGMYLLIFSLVLMVYMIPEAAFGADVPGVATRNGATRWITIGGLFDIQPSEIAKLALVLLVPALVTINEKLKNNLFKKYRKPNADTRNGIVKLLIEYSYFFVLAIIGALIFAQKDLDTLIIIALIFFSMVYAGSESKEARKILFTMSIIGAVIFLASALFVDYRRDRITSYVEILLNGEPEDKVGKSFQVWNGLVGIGSGGIFGLGFGESRQKLDFLNDAAYTDSIFVVFAEEFGLVGTIMLLSGYLLFCSIGFKVAKNCSIKYLSLVATGATMWIGVQSLLNIGANLAIIPFGGMPLPFFTYGGSSTITTAACVGLILLASKYTTNRSQTQRADFAAVRASNLRKISTLR